MTRHRLTPRTGWQETVRNLGLAWHTDEGDRPYWDESTAYQFSLGEIEHLETTAAELHALYIDATEMIIREKRWAELGIPAEHVPYLSQAWEEEEFTLYGRFDLLLDRSGQAVLLEYNADTPTALLEASVVQWQWMEEVKPHADQWNSLHEKLVAAWRRFDLGKVHFASVADCWEDEITTAYLEQTAREAGLSTTRLPMGAVGWNSERECFVDEADDLITTMFKLYPWEWMLREEFSRHLAQGQCRFLEAPWKVLWSNKAMLAMLWDLSPSHPALLPCYRSAGLLGKTYVQKPYFSREGSNISIVEQGQITAQQSGPYGAEGYIYQALADSAPHDGNWPVLGVWMVDGEPAGLGIREDSQRITSNKSRFVPHWIEG